MFCNGQHFPRIPEFRALVEGKTVLLLSNIRNKELGKKIAVTQLLHKVYFNVLI